MKILQFFKLYKSVPLIGAVLALIGWHLFSGHEMNMQLNHWLVVFVAYWWFFVCIVVYLLYIRNQWGKFKRRR